MSRHGVRPSRALGQNFLADPNLAERIARLAGVGPHDEVIEVGPGLGSLTVALAATGARVLALEIDRRVLPALAEVVEGLEVEVVSADALGFDWAGRLFGRRAVLVANLPYNVATPLVLELLISVPEIVRMLVMVQKEVGERIAARPGSRAYGAVSVRVAYFATVRLVARVPPAVFVPRPRVESVLVELTRRPKPAVAPEIATFAEIDRVLGAAFATRRKMLRRSLREMVTEEDFSRAGIDSSRRPEDLSLEEFGRLAHALREAAA